MSLKVIGAGFGRTGTYSLKSALEQLGFAKCYHMRVVNLHGSHPRMWIDAFEGKPVDWDTLFRGYQATVDWPSCTFYRQLMQHYPQAKIILTVRDPDKWHESGLRTIHSYASGKQGAMKWISRLNPKSRALRRMQRHIVWNGTFHGRFEDKQESIAVYQRHNEEVMRIVPQDRLLVYEVGDGWEPLCEFLDVPVPEDTPFPRLHTSKEYLNLINARRRAKSVK
jgi:hypothetical protein